MGPRGPDRRQKTGKSCVRANTKDIVLARIALWDQYDKCPFVQPISGAVRRASLKLIPSFGQGQVLLVPRHPGRLKQEFGILLQAEWNRSSAECLPALRPRSS
jgi:hypothetical protein